MAKRNRATKVHWVVMLIAAALGETAHAPLRNQAAASEKGPDSNPKMASADKSPGDRSKKTPPPLDLPPVADSTASTEPKKPSPPDLKKADPFAPFPKVLGLNLPLDTTTPTTISLLHTADSDGSNPAVLGAFYGNSPAGDDSQITQTPALEAVAPVDGTNAPVGVAPRGRSIPVADPVTGAAGQNTAVPEPGVLSILLGGVVLLGRRRQRLTAV